MNGYSELLSVLGQEYKEWVDTYSPNFVDQDGLEVLLEAGQDTAAIWSYEDEWNPITMTLPNGESVTYRGASFTPNYNSDEDSFAVTQVPIVKSAGFTSNVMCEVLLLCTNCEDTPNPDCDFCEGEVEARYLLNPDGSSLGPV